MRIKTRGVTAILLLAWFGPGASALAQVYVEGRLGLAIAAGIDLNSAGNDRSSVCDEYINPRAVEIPVCITPERGRGDGWQAHYDGETGWIGGFEVGYRFSGAYRVALAASRRVIDVGQTVNSTDATGTDFEKLSNEIDVGRETLHKVSGTSLFSGCTGISDSPATGASVWALAAVCPGTP